MSSLWFLVFFSCGCVRIESNGVTCEGERNLQARSFMEALKGRIKKFALRKPSKTGLMEFGRFADKHAKERSRKMGNILS